MTDATKESAPETQGEQGLPIPAFSGASDGQPTSAGTTGNTEEIVRAVLDRLTPELDKRLQSTKDQRLGKHERRLEELEGQATRWAELLQEHGGNVKKAARDIAVEEMLNGQETKPVPSSQPVQGKDPAKEYELRAVASLKKLGLSDADITEATKPMQGKSYTTVDEAVVDALALGAGYKENRAKQTAPASTAAAVTPPGGSLGNKTEEDLRTELSKLQNEDLRNPDNRARRAELRAALAKTVPSRPDIT
jgi:hypothetical protein